ncbi:hypothetical protein BBJ28_00020425 [Nothophytophthora sp. Chile5]|nr:hypothetical protein BBJ28_00020425 [Nothophytophthora sp. Chile5]
MKRRLHDPPAGVARSGGYETKVETPSSSSPASSGVGGVGSGAEMTDEMKQMVAALVSQQLVAGLLVPHGEGGSGGSRFGRVPFPAEDEQNVNAFLHQKLGKDSLTRRPGPGGRKLTYIESCKAIELANRAFGFNGWSCRIIECKEEFKRGDRWSLAFSALVRIELKDGTSHEDVGFGSSDGQRDICAALEQAKKASISDARKRALRLFGEYLGNSCYDREHIKEVHSNRSMAPLAAAPNVTLPAQQQQRQALAPRISVLQAAEETKSPALVMGRSTSANIATTTEVCVSTHNQQQPRQPLRSYTANAPPPTRMMIANHPPTPSMVKTERSIMAQAQSSAQFNMEDLSLSQFDYEPDASDAALAAKRMRM